MTDLRYAPPAATVADIRAVLPAPPSVRRACQLFVAATLLGLVGLIELPSLPFYARSWIFVMGALVLMGVFVSLTLWLILKIYQGRNWARWTVLVLVAPSWVVGAVQFSEQIRQAPIQATSGIVITALELAAYGFLFFGNGAHRYFLQRRALDPKRSNEQLG